MLTAAAEVLAEVHVARAEGERRGDAQEDHADLVGREFAENRGPLIPKLPRH